MQERKNASEAPRGSKHERREMHTGPIDLAADALKIAPPDAHPTTFAADRKPHIFTRKNILIQPQSVKPTAEMMIYESLGIRVFKTVYELFMRGAAMIHGGDPTQVLRFSRDQGDIEKFKRFTKFAWYSHVFGFISMLPVLMVTTGPTFAFLCTMNVLLNVYPCILQRYNWIRMKRAGLLDDKK